MTIMRATWVTLRVLLGIGGGYAASAACSAAFAVVSHRVLGLDRGESAVTCAMLGFVLYLFALLWAFSAARPSRVAAVFVGGSLLGYGVVQWLSPAPLWSCLPSAFGGAAG